MVVTFSDSEEHMIQKIMDVLRDEPAVEHSLEPSYASNVLTFSGLVVHMKEQTVYKNGEEVSLTHHEFFTLAYLIQHPGWVFSKEQIGHVSGILQSYIWYVDAKQKFECH